MPTKYKLNDKVVVEATTHDLIDIGFHETATLLWLQNGKPKVVVAHRPKMVFLQEPDQVDPPTLYTGWVYTSMIYKYRGEA